MQRGLELASGCVEKNLPWDKVRTPHYPVTSEVWGALNKIMEALFLGKTDCAVQLHTESGRA